MPACCLKNVFSIVVSELNAELCEYLSDHNNTSFIVFNFTRKRKETRKKEGRKKENKEEASPKKMNNPIPTYLDNDSYYNDYDNENTDVYYCDDNDLKRKLDIVSMVIYSLAFVLGVTGNGLVIFITGFRMKKTVNTVWFLNLAIADFIFTSFLPLTIVRLALGRHWPFGLVMCKINNCIAHLNMYASVYLLMVISIDRCISVRLPVWAQNHRTPRLASFVVLGVWSLAFVFSSPKLYFRHTEDYNNRIVCFDDFGESNSTFKPIIHQAMNSFQFIFAFLIPFGIIFCSYGAVVLRLRRNRLSPSNKPFKVITAVIVVFLVCWFPFYIFALLDTKVSEQRHLKCTVTFGVPLSYSLAYLNSCLNPILYVFMGHDFKEQLQRSLFSAFENAFTEHSNVNTTETRSSLTYESQRLSVPS